MKHMVSRRQNLRSCGNRGRTDCRGCQPCKNLHLATLFWACDTCSTPQSVLRPRGQFTTSESLPGLITYNYCCSPCPKGTTEDQKSHVPRLRMGTGGSVGECAIGAKTLKSFETVTASQKGSAYQVGILRCTPTGPMGQWLQKRPTPVK